MLPLKVHASPFKTSLLMSCWVIEGHVLLLGEQTLSFKSTVQILCIGTDRSQQTVQTKIRLLLKKQSDQGLCCLPFHQHLLDALMQCYIKLFYFFGQLWLLFEVSEILEFLR